jgi:hypothetical protein
MSRGLPSLPSLTWQSGELGLLGGARQGRFGSADVTSHLKGWNSGSMGELPGELTEVLASAGEEVLTLLEQSPKRGVITLGKRFSIAHRVGIAEPPEGRDHR